MADTVPSGTFTRIWDTTTDFDAGTLTQTHTTSGSVVIDKNTSPSGSQSEDFTVSVTVEAGAAGNASAAIYDDDTGTQLDSVSIDANNTQSTSGDTNSSTVSLDVYDHRNIRAEVSATMTLKNTNQGNAYPSVNAGASDTLGNSVGVSADQVDETVSATDTWNYYNELPTYSSGSVTLTQTDNVGVVYNRIQGSATLPGSGDSVDVTFSEPDGSSETFSLPQSLTDTTVAVDTSHTLDATLSNGDVETSSPSLDRLEIVGHAPPRSLSKTVISSDQIDLSWTLPPNTSGVEVYRAQSSGSTVSDYTLIDTLSGGTESYSDSGLTGDTTYYYRVRATYPNGNSDLSAEVSGTTGLGTPQNPTTAVDSNSITVSTDPVDGATGYRFYRAQSSGTTLGNYSQVAETSTPSYDDTNIEQGERYYYRVTAYTSSTESNPSNEVSAVAFLPSPTISLAANDPNGVLIEWTKEDTSPDGGWRLERRSDGASDWNQIANPALSDRQYTDTSVAAGTYEYRIVRETNHAESTATASITIGLVTASQAFVVGSGENAVQFGPDELVAKDLEKIPTGIGTARIEIPETDALIPNVQRQDRVDYYVSGTCVFTGYAVGFAGNDRTGKWTVRVDGIGKRLEETRPDYDSLGGSLTYTNTALDEALRDYWPRTPFNATVTNQSPEPVATDTLVQDADSNTGWQNSSTLGSAQPVTITGGRFGIAQTCFTTEAENGTTSGTSLFSASRFSGVSPNSGEGTAVDFTGSGQSVEITFTPQYRIPASNVAVYVRYETNNSPELEMSLNGSTWVMLTGGATISSVQWADVADDATSGVTGGYTGGDLQAGTTYTVRIDSTTSGGSSASGKIDLIAPLDSRYSYTFDNTTTAGSDGGAYLDGPELYPDPTEVELDAVGTSYNISASNVDTTWDDTSGGQAIAVSNDGGTTYTSFSNTQTVDYSYSGAGREARVKFTFDRYGSRDTATPMTGYQGQSIDSYTHKVDLNDLVVIDELELSRNHFDNLKKLHNYGDFLWTIEHDDAALTDLTVRSYPRGAITKSTPTAFQNPENRSPEVAAETYFNSVYLQGRELADGTRPTAEVKDQTAISNDGREISPGVLRDPSIGTEAGAEFRANALLQTALDNDALRGSITTTPEYTPVGYDYSLDFKGDGSPEPKTLERVSIRESAGEVQATYSFVVREQLAETINALKQNSRDQSDQI